MIKYVFTKFMQDVSGNTPLINACQAGFVETARILLDHGAGTDFKNKVKYFNAH
jgi:ankyrin repeat protein